MVRPSTVQTKPCEQCGASVTMTGKQAGQRKYWTCPGNSCSAKLGKRLGIVPKTWQPNRFRGVVETRQCQGGCGRALTRFVTESNHNVEWYCRYCARRIFLTNKGRRSGDSIPCAKCGKYFYRAPSEIKDGRRFCSADCGRDGVRKQRVEVLCAREGCDVVMHLQPSVAALKRFHNRECFRLARTINRAGYEHNGRPARLMADGYVKVWEPSHPRAIRGWLWEHVLVAENALGRRIEAGEEVDHKNGIRSDNRPENLQPLSRSDHRRKTGLDTRRSRLNMHQRLAEYEKRFGPLTDG